MSKECACCGHLHYVDDVMKRPEGIVCDSLTNRQTDDRGNVYFNCACGSTMFLPKEKLAC